MIVNISQLKQRFQLKAASKEQLQKTYGMSILAVILFYVINSVTGSIPLLNLILIGPLGYGLSKYFLLLKRYQNPQIENLFDGFNDFVKSMVLGLLITLFTILWTFLFIIPGIIAAIRYSQAYYIMIDNPNLSATEALNASKRIMEGNIGRYFVLCLSFIGWILLSMLTFGIGLIFLYPYMLTTFANFYEDLRENLIPIDKVES